MADDFKKGLDGLDRGPEASDTSENASAAPTTEHHPSVEALRGQFGDAIQLHTVMSGDEHVVYVDRARSFEILRWLKQSPEHRFNLCKDITAVDYGGNRPLELWYELWSISNKRQLRVKVVLPINDLDVDSAVPIWQTANWLEREVYDLFGINFRNHPDLRRIMMPDNYAEGHPLRKDFPLRGRFTRAEQTRRALSMSVEDFYTPDEMDVGGAVE
ncbi:MAG TPA: NADH-quinone oxidoreductase subunit C [Longimicrobiales bacterium]|nr:NADH-quinone oxidoreductase subunit C [Longimicrobiales bacterium]